jgi:hypothetical protein
MRVKINSHLDILEQNILKELDDAEALKSVAIKCAPVSDFTPLQTTVLPSNVRSAPMMFPYSCNTVQLIWVSLAKMSYLNMVLMAYLNC